MRPLRRLWYVAAGELGASPLFHRLHRMVYRLSRGRVLGRSMGCQVALLTTRGRKSGQLRTVPVFAFTDGARLIVVASNAGKQRDPAWWQNLKVDPDAEVQVGSTVRTMRAREASPEERDRLWPRLASQYGGYDVYRERTRRRIPVLVLDPR